MSLKKLVSTIRFYKEDIEQFLSRNIPQECFNQPYWNYKNSDGLMQINNKKSTHQGTV
jgi:hypothetical protein|tara:strand:- start:1864 stop:2037 length:174 start_codon:yes stop_codon:yes gene_type:complete